METEKLLPTERIRQLETALNEATNSLNECRKNQEEFIHVASHDLQAPLRKLSTFVERLTAKFGDIESEDVKIYTSKILATVQHMRALVDSLASFSELSSAENNVDKCDLNEIVDSILNEIQLVKEGNEPVIIIDKLPVITGNCVQLNQLFKNLVDNSIKFQNKENTLTINITCEALSASQLNHFHLAGNKIFYKIELIDNGIGFNEQYCEKIFQPFQRLHGKSAYEGNGMGLAICKKVIENHEGIIYAHAVESGGARFTLILPETLK